MGLDGLERGVPGEFEKCDVTMRKCTSTPTIIGTFNSNEEMMERLNRFDNFANRPLDQLTNEEKGWMEHLFELDDWYYRIEYTLRNPSKPPIVYWKEFYIMDSDIALRRAPKGGVFCNMPDSTDATRSDWSYIRHNDPRFIRDGYRYFNGASLASLNLVRPQQDKFSLIAMTEDPDWMVNKKDGRALQAGIGICLLDAQARLDAVNDDFDFQAFIKGVDMEGIVDNRPYSGNAAESGLTVHLPGLVGSSNDKTAKDDFEDGVYLHIDSSVSENIITSGLFHTASPDEAGAIRVAIDIDKTSRGGGPPWLKMAHARS
jgi:hypothetical protein